MSFSEILLIIVIALLVFGPKQIPIIIRQASRYIVAIRIYFDNIKNDIYNKSGFNEIRNLKEEVNDICNGIKQSIDIDNKVAYNDTFDNNFFENTLIYFQPELDFDREPELFDELNIDDSRFSN